MNNNKKHIVDKSGMKETPKPELTNNSSNFNETLLKIFFIIFLDIIRYKTNERQLFILCISNSLYFAIYFFNKLAMLLLLHQSNKHFFNFEEFFMHKIAYI